MKRQNKRMLMLALMFVSFAFLHNIDNAMNMTIVECETGENWVDSGLFRTSNAKDIYIESWIGLWITVFAFIVVFEIDEN